MGASNPEDVLYPRIQILLGLAQSVARNPDGFPVK